MSRKTPWAADYADDSFAVLDGNGEPFAWLDPKDAADAELIARAPDLLAENERLRQALAPFVALARAAPVTAANERALTASGAAYPEGFPWPTLGDCRNAATVLEDEARMGDAE